MPPLTRALHHTPAPRLSAPHSCCPSRAPGAHRLRRTWSPRNQGTATQAAAKASMVGALRLVASTMRRHVLEVLYRYAMAWLGWGARRQVGGRLPVEGGAAGRSGGGSSDGGRSAGGSRGAGKRPGRVTVSPGGLLQAQSHAVGWQGGGGGARRVAGGWEGGAGGPRARRSEWSAGMGGTALANGRCFARPRWHWGAAVSAHTSARHQPPPSRNLAAPPGSSPPA